MSVKVGTRITTWAEFRPAITPTTPKPPLTDPDTVKLRVTPPAGSSVDYVYETDDEVTRTSAGLYEGSFTPNADGEWSWEWISTGAVETVSDTSTATVKAGLPAPA